MRKQKVREQEVDKHVDDGVSGVGAGRRDSDIVAAEINVPSIAVKRLNKAAYRTRDTSDSKDRIMGRHPSNEVGDGVTWHTKLRSMAHN